MNKIIDCICRLLPNKALITVPTLQKGMTYVVVGVDDLDTDLPIVIIKKNKPETRATFRVPINLVGSVIVTDFGNDEDKNERSN